MKKGSRVHGSGFKSFASGVKEIRYAKFRTIGLCAYFQDVIKACSKYQMQ